eukprot:10808406-Heterocapsa_arctica.AAC.1
MRRAFSSEEISACHGAHWNLVRRFGMRQGVDTDGSPKFRTIDDHSENANNQAVHRKQRIPMAGVATIIMLVHMVYKLFPTSDIVGGSEDMKGAYRQVAMVLSQISVAITAVLNPQMGGVDLHEMWGQPFGAGHAVPNFYRLAEWLCRAVRRLLHMVLEHLFDDFFFIEPQAYAPSACWATQRIFHALGAVLDPIKSQLPVSVFVALGIFFGMQALKASAR